MIKWITWEEEQSRRVSGDSASERDSGGTISAGIPPSEEYGWPAWHHDVGPTDSEDKVRCISSGDTGTTNYLKMMIDGYLSFFLPLTLPTYHYFFMHLT